MTPDELGELTGYSPQTINKWVREKGWKTVKVAGVKGGKAHAIIMDESVRNYFLKTRHMRNSYPEFSRSEEPVLAYNNTSDTPERQIMEAVKSMSLNEKQKLAALLLRDGISGLLLRLGINDDEA